jgi:hypothetical protein
MTTISNLWAAFKQWIKSLDEEWDEALSESASTTRVCKDVDE